MSKYDQRQPAAGKWEGLFETRAFANKRIKDRKANKAAKASRKKNRK